MPFSTRTMRSDDWQDIRHFPPSEFRYPGKMGYEFMRWLDQVREKAGVPMQVVSSYRERDRNADVGGAADSAHCDEPCNAVDIGKRPRPDDKNWNRSRWKIITAAIELGCTRIGMYPSGSLHLDRTEDRRPSERVWVMVDNPART